MKITEFKNLKFRATTSPVKESLDKPYPYELENYDARQAKHTLRKQGVAEGSNNESLNHLVSEFLKSISPKELRYYIIRDNCGPAALHMKDWAEGKGIDLTRHQGYFVADNVVYDKADFTKEMKREFIKQGLDFNDPTARKQFIESNPKYSEEWKKIPHYWLQDKQGNIYDPTGYIQFVKTGLSSDLAKSRYTPIRQGVAEGSEHNQQDLDDVADWMNTTPDKLSVEVKQEPIEKFIKQIREMYGTYDEFPEDEDRTNSILKLLKRGAKPLPIYVEAGDPHLFVMEGRHRMVAFWLAGMKTIPVAYVSNSQQGVAEGTLNEFDYNKHVKMLKSYMKKLGYSYVGHGTDAHVFAKEEGSVIKVLIPRSGDISTAKNPLLAFLNYCIKNAGNPHLPKFIETTKQPIQLGSEKFDQVVMERLQEVDPEYENMLVSMTDGIEDGKPLDPQYQPYIKFYQTLKSVMLTGRKLGFENDIITFQSVNIMQRGDTLVIIDPWTGGGRLAEGTLNEIDFSSSLGNLALTDKEIISNSSKDGSIGSRPVFFFQNGSDSLYFFIDNSKIDALIYLHGDRLLGMKNFSNNNGLIYNLFHYVLNIKDQKIHLASVDKLTPDGLQWIIKQIKHPTGFNILDQQGNKLDPKALYDEWELARTTGKPGPTSIFISKSTISKKIRENENRLMPMDIFGATLIESTDHKNFIPDFINNKQGVAEDEHEPQPRPRVVDSMKSMVDVGGIQLNVAIDGAEVSIRPIVDGYQAGYAVFDRDGSTLVPFDLAIDEKFRGRGIAKIIYDYVKSLGFTIRRSSDQTKAGKHFWDKNRGEDSYVWEQTMTQENLDEACWKGYHKEGNKKMFGKTYPNCVKNTNEDHQQCPECGGPMFSEELINEKKDACYYKVKSRYKVWPSAYASGALVKCRKKGANNWGNSTKNESAITEGLTLATENLHKWFKEKWVRFGPDGKIRGHCARGGDSEGKPKCLPQAKAHSLGKKGRAKAAARKRRQDPNPERSGKAINVATK